MSKIDIPGLTPEQEERVRLMVASAKREAVEEYTRKAQWFRSWINEHPALWAAQRFGATGFVAGVLFTYGVLSLIGKV